MNSASSSVEGLGSAQLPVDQLVDLIEFCVAVVEVVGHHLCQLQHHCLGGEHLHWFATVFVDQRSHSAGVHVQP